MPKLVHRLAICGALVVGAALAPVAVASAETVIPFQFNPAPYGNSSGSFDSPPASCVVVVGEQPGVAKVTVAPNTTTNCYLISEIRWLNLSTGASGSARLSDGVGGIPTQAILQSGPGQVALIGIPDSITTVPGFATFYVP